MPDQNTKSNSDNDDNPDDIIKFSKFISKVMTSITKNLSDISEQGSSPYSFNIKIGPDGLPMVENLQMEPKTQAESKKEAPKEPLVDVLDEGDALVIVAELKGIRKEDISVSAKAEEITISVNNDAAIYSRNIALPALIDPSRGRAKYNNGVLQIRLKKKSTKATYAIKVN
ncbi:MAG: Hsp20/alpha crystallin family protein [Candidatus Marsarchaeota archaeon]|jgi:Molecular chaperone (small heat shock protein)|nr:Hsp20/alpha crystallin family protein [Candidatus Marsarchaeota archaeon]